MLYLLRHGETEWNRVGRRQGRGDSPLTELGMRQAQACGLALRGDIADSADVILYTSPLGRARTTAEIVRSWLQLPPEHVVIEDSLAELDHGEWQGMTNAEIDCRYPGVREERDRDEWNRAIPGGESYAMLERRVLPWITRRLAETTTAIVVAHDMVSRVLRGIYLGLEPARTLVLVHPHTRIYRFSNGAISALEAK
jgi:broad specificity phosphatase PhoE